HLPLREEQGEQGKTLLALRAEPADRPVAEAELELVQLRPVGGVGAAEISVPAPLQLRRERIAIPLRTRAVADLQPGQPPPFPQTREGPSQGLDRLPACRDQRLRFGLEALVQRGKALDTLQTDHD